MDSESNTISAENRTIHRQGDSIAGRTDLQILYLLQFLDEFFDTLRQLKHHLLHLSLSKSGNLLSRAKNYM